MLIGYFQTASKMIGNSTNERCACISKAWMDYPSWWLQSTNTQMTCEV